MSDFKSSIVGPGSQAAEPDIGDFEYMEMPKSMVTFAMPDVPEPEDTTGMEEGKAVLDEVLKALQTYKVGTPAVVFNLEALDPTNLGLINQIVGEGEVAIISGPNLQAQESVLAGVWRVHHLDETGQLIRDTIEVGDYPSSIRRQTFEAAKPRVTPIDEVLPEGVFNAPPVLVEIDDKAKSYQAGTETHAINLTLLPQTEADQIYIQEKLGSGATTILSRGYGNCRISSTGTKNVWWVQYYNSQDSLILNSIEIVDIPEVAIAAQEDIEESADRLHEILEVYR